MSQQNKTTLQSAINAQIADNLSGDISAADVRDNLINMTDSLLFNTGSQDITGSLTITEGVTLVSASTSQTVGQGAINLQSTSSTIIPSVILATSNGLKWIKIGYSGGYNSIASAGDTWIYGSTSLNLESNNDVNIWSSLNATQGLTVTGSIDSTGSVTLGKPDMFGNRNLSISFNNDLESVILAAGATRTNGVSFVSQTGTSTLRAGSICEILSPVVNVIAPITNITGSTNTSGSLTVTGSLTTTGGITGSLLGTASFATTASHAISASWAPSAASNPFPFTGSAIISGSLGVTGSVAIENGDITITPSSPTTKITISDGFMKNQMTKTSTEIINQASPYNFSLGSYIYDPVGSPFFPTSNAIYSSGTTDLLISSQQKLNIEATSTEITGSLTVTGSTSLKGLMTLQPANPLPSVTNGSIAYSSSGDFYFGSGSAWRKLTL